MHKIKLLATGVVKDSDFRKVFLGAVILGVGGCFILNGGLSIGKKLGAERIIQTAENMQPGFRDSLRAFVKEV